MSHDDTHGFGTPEVLDRDAVHLAVIRERVALPDLPALFDRAYPAIFGALAAAGIHPAAAPMGVTHGTPADELDLSVAVPIAEPLPEAASAGGVAAETLPAGRAATLLVRGDYALLGDAYGHLFGWIAEQGLTPRGIAFEQYLTEPEPGGDPAKNETLIGVLLAP